MGLEERDSLMKTGRCAYSAIVEMVDALNCDYDRLQELVDERDALETDEERATFDAEHDEERLALVDAAGDCESEDEARTRIEEDALSVLVRSGWAAPGEAFQAEEFELLLTTGGPAVRIRGELNEYAEPVRAWLEVQDWGTPWVQFFDADSNVLLDYARCFYFGG